MSGPATAPEEPAPRTGTARVAALVLFAVLGANGAVSGALDAPGVTNAVQGGQVAAQIVYGLGALVVVALLWRRTPLPRWLLPAWAVTAAVAGGLAAVGWGEAGWLAGAAAGAGTLAVAAAFAWVARRGSRA